MKIKLDHGAGGYLSKNLIDEIIIPKLKPVYLGIMEDSGIANVNTNLIAFTTDSYVVSPIFFGNCDIGKISICGTVNDLVVSGATPKYLSLSFIIEEGLDIIDLETILDSICKTCIQANVKILAGDTKVVRKGEADKIYINTSGIGTFESNQKPLHLKNINVGDSIIVTGLLGNHGIHILSMREGLGFENVVPTDCAPLNNLVLNILSKYGEDIHYIRDLTRGGLGNIINEISVEINKNIILYSESLPIQKETIMAGEMLGINPLYLANEGNLCIFCDPKITKYVLEDLRKFNESKAANECGIVAESDSTPNVVIQKDNGISNILDFLRGAELARLC